MASSSSSCCKFDVFLSFRGEDTRDNFTSHLYAALCRKKIKTFIDDEELRRGDDISPALLNAIQGSKISVIIFSKDYASSKWCLDELVKILDCKNLNGQMVVPVFYQVDPSDVRKQTGCFRDAFVKHQKQFKDMPEKAQNWKAALTQASNLSGWASKEIRSEAQLVDVIVKDILKKLENVTASTYSDGFVGLNSRIQKIKSLLCIGLPDFRTIGIWGMGGIGKTTLAGAVFKLISREFEGKCFMPNVREESENGGGLVYLRDRVVSEIFQEDIKIGTPYLPDYIVERLNRMKVLTVLDDVNKVRQLHYLACVLDQFGPGSRIIITTRDKRILDDFGVCDTDIYEVNKLRFHEALVLFSNFAFKENQCPGDLLALLERVLKYANGNPLALRVLGSFFHRKSKSDWEKALENLNRISDPDIYDVLKISYNDLRPEEKSMFLDIACFFAGEKKDFLTCILDDPNFPHCGLNVLIEKSLITMSGYDIRMHDLLQEMGREIVRQECVKEPGKRSRLWYHEDVCHVLKKNKGTDAIEGIFLNLSQIGDIHLNSRAFANMSNLRLLKFYMPEHRGLPIMSSNVRLDEDLECLPEELRYLYWHEYPLKTLPLDFDLENLIALHLPYSEVEQIWKGQKEAFKLKFIDLHDSHNLTSIPEPLEAPNLERINLCNCTNLSYIPLYVQNFHNLGSLSLKGCKSLRCFPRNIHFRSPIEIDCAWCVNLTEFPQISGKVVKLRLWYTPIEEVPSSIECLTNLETLDLRLCERLKRVSTSICKLKSLGSLLLAFCSNLEGFPEILEKMELLETLDLERTGVKELPPSFENLQGLRQLSLIGCSELKCSGWVLPTRISKLSSLERLQLSGCEIKEIPEDIDCLSSLEVLDLSGSKIEILPTSIGQLSRLRQLNLLDCNMLQSIPELPRGLLRLNAQNCRRLRSLPELPSCLEDQDFSTKWHTLSDGSQEICIYGRIFIFANCLKLNEKANNKSIWAEMQKRIHHLATVSLRLFYQKGIDESRGISICLPGRAIPDWFGNQSLGSSITIQLPQHCCNKYLIGFALSAVIEFVGGSDADESCYFRVGCKYSFEQFCELFDHSFILVDSASINSDHVILGFDHCWDIGLPEGDRRTAVSFHFFISHGGKGHKVKCCGVNPVYANPDQAKTNTFTLKFAASNEEECAQHGKLHNNFLDNKADMTGTTDSVRSSDEDEQRSSSFSPFFRKRCAVFAFLIFVFLVFIWSHVGPVKEKQRSPALHTVQIVESHF
ncbi:Disease resistance-like protein DSC1 [Citrus sinensis]|uniref:disease resistance-like protein DSC1 n=1 Tax=Citrus sinensis TaxID=2711 RepID=UPI00219AF256|nr:disease resistance-like protein DSC1 [Citrus sinensis]KAH9725277.1 Disease resistance-like protein DSC1 [Citrus sinensis]